MRPPPFARPTPDLPWAGWLRRGGRRGPWVLSSLGESWAVAWQTLLATAREQGGNVDLVVKPRGVDPNEDER